MSAKAFLVARIDTTKTPPTVVSIGIYDVPPWDVPTDWSTRYCVELNDSMGVTYEDAATGLRDMVANRESCAWMRPLMERG